MRSYVALLFLGLAVHAIAHGDDHDDDSMVMDMDTGADDKPDSADVASSYFDHPDDKLFIYAHIAVMTLSWIFALPIGVSQPSPLPLFLG